jgi:hypothetical protein
MGPVPFSYVVGSFGNRPIVVETDQKIGSFATRNHAKSK